jgi:hypothetical protein
MTGSRSDRDITALLVDASGQTLSAVDGQWAVCPTGVRPNEPEVLIWHPESSYGQESSKDSQERIKLFRSSYAREFKILHYDHFLRTLRNASKGRVLEVQSRLLAAVPLRESRFTIEIDQLYTAESGVSFTDGDRHLALLMTDGGYHNADTFYMLFAQQGIGVDDEQSLLGISDIEGGYRGIFAVDLDSGADLWTARTGVTPVRVHADDINGDGLDEFVVQCYSAENGVSGGGTTDACYSYVLCIDQWGYILWKKRFAGVHIGTIAAISDVTGDRRPEVIAVCSSTRDSDMGYAAVLSGEGETLVERSDLGGLYGIAVYDFQGTGKSQVVTGGPDGVTVMLDGGLNVVMSHADTVDYMAIPNWTSRLGTITDMREADVEQCYERVVPFCAFDYDGDGDVEVFAVWTALANAVWKAHDRGGYFPPRGDLIVFDERLQEEDRVIISRDDSGLEYSPGDAPASLKSNIYPVDMDGDGVSELVLSNGLRGGYVFKVEGDE